MSKPAAMTVRCPECGIAFLNTPTIQIRREKRHRVSMPVKVCHRCKIIIAEHMQHKGWKVWNGKEYLEFS